MNTAALSQNDRQPPHSRHAHKASPRHWYRTILLAVVVVFLSNLLLGGTLAHAMQPCVTDSRSNYSVTVCISAPLDGATLSGSHAVQAAVSFSGTNPGIAKLTFYLDNQYLLVDYQAGYTFTLPTSHFVDGTHVLSVEAILRDGFVTSRPPLNLVFNNGITQAPVNTNTFTPSSGSTPTPGAPFVLSAVGDGASGETAAGQVSDLLVSWNPNMFLYLGDVYEKGTSTEFYNWYGTSETYFGRLKSITNPVVGNHEFENGVAPGYFDYWDNIPNYYSYDASGWHFIALDSNASGEIGSTQYAWTVQDLAANPEICTIAYFHHPIFNVGPQGGTPRFDDTWALLAQNGVDIVLTGHDHNYQRWLPLDASGSPSASGVTHFVVGGGGHGLRAFTTSDSRLAKGFDSTPDGYGALRLELNSAGAAFQYINTRGSVADAGVIPCRGAAPDSQPPGQPGNLAAAIDLGVKVRLTWNAAGDNTGVVRYDVYRDDQLLTAVDGSATSFVDMSTHLSTAYTYQVVAVDLAGNASPASNPVVISTPSNGAVRYLPAADSYVNQSLPTANYGSLDVLRSDISPDLRTYLRYHLEGVNGQVVSAKLRLYTKNSTSIGYKVNRTAGQAWSESTLTYNNAPGVGVYIGSSGAYISERWTEVDITPQISGDMDLDLVITTDSNTALTFSSREGANPPELVLTVSDSIVQSSTPSRSPTPAVVSAPGRFTCGLQVNRDISAGRTTSSSTRSVTCRPKPR